MRLFLLTTLIALAFASPSKKNLFMFDMNDEDADQEPNLSDDPKPCCLPDTWQGVSQTVVGTASGRGKAKGHLTSTQIYLDGKKKRVAGKVIWPKGKCGVDLTFIGLFNETSGQGFKLFVFNSNATKCWNHYWDKFKYEPACIPQNSTFAGTFKVGLASSGIAVNAWAMGARRGRFGFYAELLVTADDKCVPVAFRESGQVGGGPPGPSPPPPPPHSNDDESDNEPTDAEEDQDKTRLLFKSRPKPRPRRKDMKFVLGAMYSDIELQIKDESVFNVPSICQKSGANFDLYSSEIDDPQMVDSLENLEAILENIII